VVGAVVRLDRLDGGALPMMAGQIVVAPAATPALALALVDARALVCATGGLLDHGAAMARELGLPYVVGCAGAWDALTTGELVAVDGEAGTVSRL
jgi:phosphohistidine swiveling domain-containing protein